MRRLLAVTADGGEDEGVGSARPPLTPTASPGPATDRATRSNRSSDPPPSEPRSSPVELSLLAERESGALRRLAYARIGSWEAAEDVVQDVLADAHRRWSTLQAYDDPMAWARRAVLNRSASFHRRRGRERRALARLAGRADVTPAVEPRLDDAELWNAIRSLSDRQIDVVLLLWFEDLPAAEVATVLGCAEDTVRTHWRRARAHLARALDEREEGER